MTLLAELPAARTTPRTPAPPLAVPARGRNAVLTLSTLGFTLLFAVWLMFGVLAIPIRTEFGLTEMQFSWLTAIAILNGAFWRLLFGIIADRWGGRRVMIALLLATAVPTALVSFAHSYQALFLLAFLVGMAGNGFSIGIAWNSAWFPKSSQGFALGVFGAGNVGASVTKLIGPAMIALIPAAGFAGGMIPGGWRFIPLFYAALLVVTAVATWLLTPAVEPCPSRGRPLGSMLRPLACVRVWRFSLYYVVVFGAYVALSVWLPKYYKDVYQLSLPSAALLTALFIFPASLLRPLGGYLSDKFGARRIMYGVFTLIIVPSVLLCVPDCQVGPIHWHSNATLFTVGVFAIGVGMGIGKAAVYKYIPQYFPQDVGAVGGLVGALGALGGFFLPLSFGYLGAVTGFVQIPFAVLAVITLASLAWLHVTVRR